MHIIWHGNICKVTGGSGGIGKAIATEVIKEGGRVSLFARGQYGLEDAKNEIVLKTNCNPNAIQIFPGDVNDSLDALTKIIDDSEKNHGPIFMLVNTAGYAVAGRFEDLSVDNFKMKRFLSTNGFEGTILTTVCCGMAPITSYFELTIQVLFAGICRAVSAFYLIRFDNIVKAEKNKAEQSKRK